MDNTLKVEDLISKGIVELKMFDTKPEHAKEYGFDVKKPLYVQSICITENERLKGIGKKVLDYIDDYAVSNGNDLIFGHITQKASFTKDSRQSALCDIDLIKEFLMKGGYSTIKGNNDFYKIIKTNPDIRFDGGGLVVPKKPINMNDEQWELLFTPEFKDWFGDWTKVGTRLQQAVDNGQIELKDYSKRYPIIRGEEGYIANPIYEGISKVMISTRPKIVYHATNSLSTFYTFKENQAHFFAELLEKAGTYGKRIIPVYLDIKKPFIWDASCNSFNESYGLIPSFENALIEANSTKKEQIVYRSWAEYVIPADCDGIIIKNIVDTLEQGDDFTDEEYDEWIKKYCSDIYIVVNSNQIKLADGTNTTFDANNPDIRFEEGGGVDDNTETWRNKYNKKYSYSKNASHNLHEISKDTGVSVKGLQQIYNKGVGAYKTNPSSVRPNVKSKEQWGMGRVYSAVMGGKASKVDAKELKMNKGGKTLSDMDIKQKLAEGGVITQNEILAMKNYIESPNANIKLINTYKKILAKFNVDIDNLNLSLFPKGDYIDTYKFSGYDYMKEKNQEMGVSFLLTGEYELVSKAIYEKDYSMWLFYNYLGRINISFDACKKWLEEAQEHFSYTMPIPIFLVHTPNAKDGRSYAMWFSVSEEGLEQAISKIGRPITWSYNSRYYYQEIGMVGNFDNPKWEGWGSMYKERKTGLLIPEYTETSFHFNTLIHEFAHCLDFQTQLVNNISKYEQRDKTIKEQREYTDIEKELYGNQLIERMETYNQPITNHFDHFVDALIRILRASSSGKIPLTQQYEQQAINVQTSLSGVYGDLLLEQRERKRKLEVQVARDEEVRDNKRFTWQSKWVEDVRDYAQKNAKQEGLKEAISKSNRSRPFYLTEILEFDGLITKYMDDVFRGYMALNPTKAPALLDAIKRMKVETNRLINNHYDNIRNNFIYGMKPTSEMEIGLMNNCDPRQEDNYKKWKDCAKLYIG